MTSRRSKLGIIGRNRVRAENAFNPDWVVAPGETLKEWRQHTNVPPRAAATVCGRMPVGLYLGIEAGTEPITKDIAKALGHGTGIPATLWLNLERAYREGLAAGKTVLGEQVPADVAAWWREKRYSVADLQRAFAEGQAAPDGLRELSEAASSGPWEFEGLTGDGWALIFGDTPEDRPDWNGTGYTDGIVFGRADAAYIVALVNWHRARLTEVGGGYTTEPTTTVHIQESPAGRGRVRRS